MWSHFKPLRRKLGIAMLLLACLFVAGWMRSFWFEDAFFFPNGPYITDSVFSSEGLIGWRRDDESVWDMRRDDRDYGFPSSQFVKPPNYLYPGVPEWRWGSQWCGFGVASGQDSSGGDARKRTIPYWSIVLPLTLLSGWLLLSKLPASKPMPASEP